MSGSCRSAVASEPVDKIYWNTSTRTPHNKQLIDVKSPKLSFYFWSTCWCMVPNNRSASISLGESSLHIPSSHKLMEEISNLTLIRHIWSSSFRCQLGGGTSERFKMTDRTGSTATCCNDLNKQTGQVVQPQHSPCSHRMIARRLWTGRMLGYTGRRCAGTSGRYRQKAPLPASIERVQTRGIIPHRWYWWLWSLWVAAYWNLKQGWNDYDKASCGVCSQSQLHVNHNHGLILHNKPVVLGVFLSICSLPSVLRFWSSDFEHPADWQRKSPTHTLTDCSTTLNNSSNGIQG